MLPPELQSQLAREPASAIAKSGRVDGIAPIMFFVDDRAGKLRVMAPGPAIEVVRSDGRPYVVDDADLGVHVNRCAVGVLDVIDGDAIGRRTEKHSHRLLPTDLGGPQREC